MIKAFVVAAISVLALARVASGQTLYNIDWDAGSTGDTYTGEAVLGYNSTDTWNEITYGAPSPGTTYSDIKTSSNAASTVDFIQTDGASGYSESGPTTPNPSGLMIDYAFNGNPGGLTETFTGLTTGDTFELVIYTTGNNADQGDEVTLTDGGSTSYGSQTDTGLDRNINNATNPGDNYLVFIGTVSSADELNAAISSTGSGSTFEGAQLLVSPVPEPRTEALMAVGLAALIWGVRRRRIA